VGTPLPRVPAPLHPWVHPSRSLCARSREAEPVTAEADLPPRAFQIFQSTLLSKGEKSTKNFCGPHFLKTKMPNKQNSMLSNKSFRPIREKAQSLDCPRIKLQIGPTDRVAFARFKSAFHFTTHQLTKATDAPMLFEQK